MDETDEQRVIAIAKALGSGGREFTAEQIVKVDAWIQDAEFQYTLSEMVLDGELLVSFDNTGDLMFAAKPEEFPRT